MLVGNKLDLASQRGICSSGNFKFCAEVSFEEASRFAEENGLIVRCKVVVTFSVLVH